MDRKILPMIILKIGMTFHFFALLCSYQYWILCKDDERINWKEFERKMTQLRLYGNYSRR